MSDSTVEAILDFWFGADSQSPADEARMVKRWFVRDDTFDDEIRRRFGELVAPAIAGELAVWAESPRGRLALLLVLDQFPRNLYRDDLAAFAGDAAAQRCALEGIGCGHDLALDPRYRAFCYLPLEHAEDLALQQRCVALFTALAEDTSALPVDRYAMYLDYARRHREVIARFGRFPHRNRVLGRSTTADEQAYLDAGGGF